MKENTLTNNYNIFHISDREHNKLPLSVNNQKKKHNKHEHNTDPLTTYIYNIFQT